MTPPAVDPGLPPINIISIVSSFPEFDSAAVSTVLNPAVLGVTEQKSAPKNFSSGFCPARDASFSVTRNKMVPAIVSTAVAVITILLCSRYLLKCHLLRATSSHTIKPIPPTSIKETTTRLTTASPSNATRDEYSS